MLRPAALRPLFALLVAIGAVRSVSPLQAQPSATNDWWAVRPLQAPAPRAGNGESPVDALTRATLAARGAAAPESETDRRTLLRRLMVDLHGLLPSPEEVAEFQRDPAPDAFERVVDRLLASPRYGERWARHWLDVAHFAETHGHDQDRPRDNAWPYRDYVIESFNADKPWARFVQEQVAADALFPDEPQLIPALGFLAAGPWDESSLRDIREDTLDREIGRYLDRDDIVSSVMTSFTSVTAHCARCHDHKFDPISQRDYYGLQAVFAGTEKAERFYDPDPVTHHRREFWMRVQTALERRDAALLEELLTPELRAEQAAWESTASARIVPWEVLRPEPKAEAAVGELELQPDGSLLARGPAPATNTYTFTAFAPSAGVTALRLELLPDDSLPARGPGRAVNGNLHLTDLRLLVARPDRSAAGFTRVELVNPSADFNQSGWEIGKAVDTDPQTGWGIHPEEGRPHTAVFELAAPLKGPAGTRLQVILRQDHGRKHTIGRFRLAVTHEPPPICAGPLPETVLTALARAPADRTEAQRFEVAALFLANRPARELDRLPAPRRVFAGAGVFPANGGQKARGRPRPIEVLRRGEITKPVGLAAPGALACVGPLGVRFESTAAAGTAEACVPEEARRRAALARWLTDPGNPLVWRSIVNRAWHYHFGRGIVETPNDFGRMGAAPVAPELLDWLAVTFRDDLHGSLKALHRLILTSRTWRARAADPQSAGPLQPLSRRLDAETFRDSLLRLTGRLDDTMGGPSVRQFAMSEGIHVTPKVDYAAFDPDTADGRRRSIYRFLFRTLPDPLMDTLDCPAGDQSAPVRPESFTALQAFALLNHPFATRQSERLAERIASECHGPADQVRRACQLLWQREPTADEAERFLEHTRRHGLAQLCRVLLNSNEFHFLH